MDQSAFDQCTAREGSASVFLWFHLFLSFFFVFFMGRPQTHLKNTVEVTSFSVDIKRKAASAGTLGRHANSNVWGWLGATNRYKHESMTPDRNTKASRYNQPTRTACKASDSGGGINTRTGNWQLSPLRWLVRIESAVFTIITWLAASFGCCLFFLVFSSYQYHYYYCSLINGLGFDNRRDG